MNPNAAHEPIIKIENLYKKYGDNVVLDGFNLNLYKGENLVIMGKSGSGKSVMIKCLIGLEIPDSGTIEIMSQKLEHLSLKALDEIRADIGFLFQGSALYDSMTVKFGNVKDTLPLVEEALQNVGLKNVIDLMPNELSGGMKRRVALARTLILKPKIIIYDEPTTGLDPITSKEIILLMKSVQEKYKTSSIIITHDVDCARVIANRMILLIDGKNYAEGTFAELSTSQDPKVKAFFK